jgi:cell division protein FtsL
MKNAKEMDKNLSDKNDEIHDLSKKIDVQFKHGEEREVKIYKIIYPNRKKLKAMSRGLKQLKKKLKLRTS